MESILLNISDTNAPVVGTGKTLGFTNGAQNGGMFGRGNYQNNELFSTNYFNVDVGSHQSYGNFFTTDESAIGVTSDPEKSGLIATFSGLTLGTIPSEKLGNFYIKY